MIISLYFSYIIVKLFHWYTESHEILRAQSTLIFFRLLFVYRCATLSLTLAIVLYAPPLISQLFTWIVFAVIASVMCYRKSRQDDKKMPDSSELKKKLSVVVLLFIFLGLPWVVIVAGALIDNEIVTSIVIIIDALQGPALFVIRVARLKEVRQFWRRLLKTSSMIMLDNIIVTEQV